MSDNNTNISQLKEMIANFVNEREWQQFHSPKNLSMSIAIEAAELMEKFQWVDNENSKEEILKNREEIENEIADVAAYLLSLCDIYNIDLSNAIEKKLEINNKKYPIEKCKGKNNKYTSYIEIKKELK